MSSPAKHSSNARRTILLPDIKSGSNGHRKQRAVVLTTTSLEKRTYNRSSNVVEFDKNFHIGKLSS